ncbi:hypothetical protein EVAR_74443_1 [Eumeta japonica]|uniref:Uncharacterized protein n=1 Tax=Eumeta variegata TaxID=151549 RepID=A0A4C1YNC1_EUMVA|nr:hypothetical protein EVAR_74443_1 [Eumeta japonica]
MTKDAKKSFEGHSLTQDRDRSACQHLSLARRLPTSSHRPWTAKAAGNRYYITLPRLGSVINAAPLVLVSAAFNWRPAPRLLSKDIYASR